MINVIDCAKKGYESELSTMDVEGEERMKRDFKNKDYLHNNMLALQKPGKIPVHSRIDI